MKVNKLFAFNLVSQTADGFNNHFLAQIDILFDMTARLLGPIFHNVQKLMNLRENLVGKYRRAVDSYIDSW